MTATSDAPAAPPLTLPEPDEVRARLAFLDAEANLCRRLLRLVLQMQDARRGDAAVTTLAPARTRAAS